MQIRNRIQQYKDEQDSIQKKTFTKWINKHLKKHESSLIVKDLFVDIRDGLMLIYLLEVLSGSSIKKERGPNMKKLHYLSNVRIALNFLTEKKIKLVNINPADIVEGKPVIVLGLIWLIILYFQIQEYELDKKSQESGAVQTNNNKGDIGEKGVKLKLLTWIQNIIPREYNITITDFGKCWKNGIAFNALIEVFNPNLVDMKIVLQSDPQKNLDTAFELAEKHLGIAKLLDSEDIIADKPDEKSIMTYVSQFLELNIIRPLSPRKKIKLSIPEPDKSIDREFNDKIKRFIINVKESRIEKLKQIENFNEIFKLISGLKNELDLIPNCDKMYSTGDFTLDNDFKVAKNLVLSCQWLLDESVNNEWKNLCKWLVSSEKLLEFHKHNQIDVTKELSTVLFEEMNVQLKEFETNFKNSPFHSPILAELKRCMISTDKSNKVFVSYTISVEKRILKVVKEEFGVRQKLLLLHKIAFLKIKEREFKIKLQYWKRELDSLENAEDRLLDFKATTDTENLFKELIIDMEKLISVDITFKDWFEEFKSHWLDTEREIKYINTSLNTYIEEWHKMDETYNEILHWLNSTNEFSISPNEYNSRKQKISEFEKNIAFLSEQSSDSGKEILSKKFEYINSFFSKFHEDKSLDIDNLRKEYKIKVDNIKKWLEKSEALESFDIKFSKASINEYMNILDESNKTSENVKLDFQMVSKIGQKISRSCSKEESERMLGELKIQKIRLLTLIDDRPKLIKKMNFLSEIFYKCENLFSDIDQWISQTENNLAEILANFHNNGNQQREMFLNEINVCLESITSKKQSLTNVKRYIGDIESLKLSNFPLKPIYSRENQTIEKLNDLQKFAIHVSKKIRELTWFTPFKSQLETWIEETNSILNSLENLDPESAKTVIENSLKIKDSTGIALEDILLKIQNYDELKDEGDNLKNEFNKISSKLSEAINYQKYRKLENECIEFIKNVEKQLDDEEMLAKHANLNKVQEIINKHQEYFEESNFKNSSQSYLLEMKILLDTFPKNQAVSSKVEMLEQQCMDLNKRIDTVGNDLLNMESSLRDKNEKISKLNELVTNLANISSNIELTDLNVSSDQYDMVLSKFCSLIPDVDNMKEIAIELKTGEILSHEEILEETIYSFESMVPTIESLKRKGSIISDAIKLKEEAEKETEKLQSLKAQLHLFNAITIGGELILLGELRQQERVVEQLQELHREVIENTRAKFTELELIDPTVALMVLPTIENLQELCELAELESIEVLAHNSNFINTKILIEKEMNILESKMSNLEESSIVPINFENEQLHPTILEAQMSLDFINDSQSQIESQLSKDYTDFVSNFHKEKSEKIEQIQLDAARKSNIKIVKEILQNCIFDIESDLINISNSIYKIPLDKSKTILINEKRYCENMINNNFESLDDNLKKIVIAHGNLNKIDFQNLTKEASESLENIQKMQESINSLYKGLSNIHCVEDVSAWKESWCDLGNKIFCTCQSLKNCQRILNTNIPSLESDLSIEKIGEIYKRIESLEFNSKKQTINIQSQLSLIDELEKGIDRKMTDDKDQLLKYKDILKIYAQNIDEIKNEEILPVELKDLMTNLSENPEIEISINKIKKLSHNFELKFGMMLDQENEHNNQIVNAISLQLFDEFTDTDNQLDAIETISLLESSLAQLQNVKTNTEKLQCLSENFGNHPFHEKTTKQIDKTLKDCIEISEICISKIDVMKCCKCFVDRLNELEQQSNEIKDQLEESEDTIIDKRNQSSELQEKVMELNKILGNLNEKFSINQIFISPVIEERVENLKNQLQFIKTTLDNKIESVNENKKKFELFTKQRLDVESNLDELMKSLDRVEWNNSNRTVIENNHRVIKQIEDQFNDQITKINNCKQILPNEKLNEIDNTVEILKSKLTSNNARYEEQIDLISTINDKSECLNVFPTNTSLISEVDISILIKNTMEKIQDELKSIDNLKIKIDEQFEHDDGELLPLLDKKQLQLINDLESIKSVSENHNNLIDLRNEVKSISDQLKKSIINLNTTLKSPEKSKIDVEEILQNIHSNLEKVIKIQSREPLFIHSVFNESISEIQAKLSKDITDCIQASQLCLDPINILMNQYQEFKIDVDKCTDEIDYLRETSVNDMDLLTITKQLEQIDHVMDTLSSIQSQLEINRGIFTITEICEISDQCTNNIDKLNKMKFKIVKQQGKIKKDQEQLKSLLEKFNNIKDDTLKNLSDFISQLNTRETVLNFDAIKEMLSLEKDKIDTMKIILENIQNIDKEKSGDCARQLEEIENLLESLDKSYREITEIVKVGNNRVNAVNDKYVDLLSNIDLDSENIENDINRLNEIIENFHVLKIDLTEILNENYPKFDEINSFVNRAVSINKDIDNTIYQLNLKLKVGQENQNIFNNIKTNLIEKSEKIRSIINKINQLVTDLSNEFQESSIPILQEDINKLLKIQSNELNLSSPVFNNEISAFQTDISNEIDDCIQSAQLFITPAIECLEKYRILKQQNDQYSDEIDFLENEFLIEMNLEMLDKRLDEITILLENENHIKIQIEMCKKVLNFHEIIALQDNCESQIKKLEKLNQIIVKHISKIKDDQQNFDELMKYFIKIRDCTGENLSDLTIKINAKKELLNFYKINDTIIKTKENLQILNETKERIKEYNLQESLKKEVDIKILSESLFGFEVNFNENKKILEDGNKKLDEINDEYQELIKSNVEQTENNEIDLLEILKIKKDRIENLDKRLGFIVNKIYPNFEEVNEFLDKTKILDSKISQFSESINSQLEIEIEKQLIFNNLKNKLINISEEVKSIYQKILNSLNSIYKTSHLSIKDIELLINDINQDLLQLISIQLNKLNLSSPVLFDNQISQIQQTISIEITKYIDDTKKSIDQINETINQFYICRDDFKKIFDETDFRQELIVELNVESLDKRLKEIDNLIEKLDNICDNIDKFKLIINVSEIDDLYNKCKDLNLELQKLSLATKNQRETNRINDEKVKNLMKTFETYKENMMIQLEAILDKSNDKSACLNLKEIENGLQEFDNEIEKLNDIINNIAPLDDTTADSCRSQMETIKLLNVNLINLYKNVDNVVKEKSIELNKINIEYETLIETGDFETLNDLEVKRDQLKELRDQMSMFNRMDQFNFQEIRNLDVDTTNIMDKIDSSIEMLNSQFETELAKEELLKKINSDLDEYLKEINLLFSKLYSTESMIKFDEIDKINRNLTEKMLAVDEEINDEMLKQYPLFDAISKKVNEINNKLDQLNVISLEIKKNYDNNLNTFKTHQPLIESHNSTLNDLIESSELSIETESVIGDIKNQLIQSKNALLLSDKPCEYFCCEQVNLNESKSIEIENIDNLLNRIQILTEKCLEEKLKKEFNDGLEKIKSEIDFLKEFLLHGNPDVSISDITNRIDKNLLVARDLEIKYNYNPLVADQIQRLIDYAQISENIKNQFDEYLSLFERNENILNNANQIIVKVEEHLNSNIDDDPTMKIQKLNEFKCQLEYPELIIDNKLKESQFLITKAQEITENIKNLQNKMSKKIQNEKIKLKLLEIRKILTILLDNNIIKSLKDMSNYFSQANTLMDSIIKEIDELGPDTNEELILEINAEKSKICQIETVIIDLSDKINIGEIAFTEHCEQIKQWTNQRIETVDDIIELKSLMNNHIENLIYTKNNLKNEIFCLDLIDVIKSLDDSISETTEKLENLKLEEDKILIKEKFLLNLTNVEIDIDRLQDIINGENDCLSEKDINDKINEIKIKLSIIQTQILDNNETINIEDKLNSNFLRISNRFLQLEKLIKEKLSILSELEMEKQSIVQDSLKIQNIIDNIDNINEIKDLQTHLDKVTGIILMLKDIGIRCKSEGLYCTKQSDIITEIHKELDNINYFKKLLEEKIKSKLDNEAALNNIKTCIREIEIKLENFKLSLLNNNEYVPFSKFEQILSDIETDFKKILKPILLDETEFETVIAGVRQNINKNKEFLLYLSQEIIDKENVQKSLQNQFKNFTNQQQSTLIDLVDQYKIHQSKFNEYDKIRILNCDLSKEVTDLEIKIHCQEISNLLNNINRLDEEIKILMISVEENINTTIEKLQENLDEAKLEQETWLKESIKTLQNSTQNSTLVPAIFKSRKETLEGLIDNLQTGNELIDKVYQLEEQMKEINSKFNENQCTHRDRKASVIQYMELIHESQRRFDDISEKYAQAFEFAKILETFLKNMQMQLINIPKEHIHFAEITQFILNLQNYRDSMESKLPMKDNLLILEKALISEGVTTNDLNTIDIENLYVKTIEDVDDLIGMMTEIITGYDELSLKLIDECRISEEIINSVSFLLNYDVTSENCLLSESCKNLKELKQKLLEQYEIVKQLRIEIETFHYEKSIVSDIIPKILTIECDLENNLKLVTDKINEINCKMTLIDQVDKQAKELSFKIDEIENDIQCLKSKKDLSQEIEFWPNKIAKLQDISMNLSDSDQQLDKLIEEVIMNGLENKFDNIKNRICENEKQINDLQKNWQFIQTILVEKENILNLIQFFENRIKFAETCENEIDLVDNALKDLLKLNEDINSVGNKIESIIFGKIANLSDEEQLYVNSIAEKLKNKLLNSSSLQEIIYNNLDNKLKQLNKLNDINVDVMQVTNTLSSIDDCDSMMFKLDEMRLSLNGINHSEIIHDKKQIIDNLLQVLQDTQNIIKEIQNRIDLFENIQSDLKHTDLQIENVQQLFLDPHFSEVDHIENDIGSIENKLEEIRVIHQQYSLDLDDFHNDLLHFMSNIILEQLSRQTKLLNDLKFELNERIKSFESHAEEKYQPTFIENLNRESNFSLSIENDETEVLTSETEDSKQSSSDLVIDEDNINAKSNQHLTHKEELDELSEWISIEMESLNNLERSLTFNNVSIAIKPLIEQVEAKKNNLNSLENSISQLHDKKLFTNEILLLKSKLTAYEDYLRNTLEATTDLDNYLSNFRKIINSIFDWIRVSKTILNEHFSPVQHRAILNKLQAESEEIQMKKIKELEAMTSEIENFEIVQANANIQNSVKEVFEEVLEKYNELNTEITNLCNNLPMNELENVISVSEEFVYITFPKWYKDQLKTTLVSSKECMIRITENRIKMAFIEDTAEKINKLIDECNVPWDKIYLDRNMNIPQHDINTTNNVLQLRHAKVIAKLSEIFKSLKKWMFILEDLKIKWQELNSNQEQFQSWLIEIQRKGDRKEGQPLHLNDNSLKEKINFLRTLKSEIESNSSKLVKMMIIDDDVTTVTFSPELNSGENLQSTNTLSDKINNQYTLLTNNIMNQIEKWHNIEEQVEMFHKSAEDLKEDFSHLKERVHRLEIQCPLTKDKLNSLKEHVTQPSFSQNSSNNANSTNLRNSGSNHGISKLLWPYSRKSDHSVGDCEMNKSSQSLLCYNYEDVRSSREKRFSSTINLNCTTSINSLSECLTINDKLSTIDCPSFRSDFSQSSNLMNILSKSHIKPIESGGGGDSCILTSSRSEWSVKKLKHHSSTNHSSGYRSYISSSNCSTYRS